MSKFVEFVKEKKSTLLQTLLVSLLLPLIVFISIPLELYKNNMQEFKFSLADFFTYCILFACVTFVVLFLILNCLPKKARKIVMFILLSIEFMFFVQGTYLNGDLNSLAGDNLVYNKLSTVSTIINASIWVLVIAGFIVLACIKDKKNIIKTVSTVLVIVICATQLINILSVSITGKDMFVSKAERDKANAVVEKDVTTKNMTEVSSNNNVFWFIVDRFDERYAERAYEYDNSVFESLSGFTWFQDYLSRYGHTYPSMASLLTLNEYEEGDRRESYLKSAYKGQTPLKVLSDNGYRVNLFTERFYTYYSGNTLPEYIANLEEGYYYVNKFKLSLSMTKMSLYRCLPFLAKKYVGSMSSQVVNNDCYFVSNGEGEAYATDNRKLWNKIRQLGFSQTDEKVFSLIHMEGCHNTDYDADFNSTDGNGDIVYSVINSFKIIGLYLDYLKANGLYDSATIVISGDHGEGESDLRNITGPKMTACFFKPASESSSSLKKSQAQVSQRNVWRAIFDSENIETDLEMERSLFDISETETTTRYFTWHTYQLEKLTSFVFEIKGKGSDFSNWNHIDTIKSNHGIMY